MRDRFTTGLAGRVLALGLLLLVGAALWVGLAAPVLAWQDERAALLEQRQMLAARMARIAASLPDLQRAAAAGGPAGPAAATLLEGATDAVAAAALQERVQEMAGRAGAPLSSAETIPGVQAGAYRQIGLHVALRASWPALIQLLRLLEQASPRMLVDDLQLHGIRLAGATVDQPLEAGFTVLAFRAGTAPAATP